MTIFEDRTRRCQEAMQENRIDALFLCPGVNMYYLTGFMEPPYKRLILTVVPAEGEPFFVVPGMYAEQVARDTWVGDLRTWSDAEGSSGILRKSLHEVTLRNKRVLLEDTAWAMYVLPIQQHLGPIHYATSSEVLRPMRMRKSEEEVEALRGAARIAEQTFNEILSLTFGGKAEREMARWITDRMMELGATSTPFTPIVASGPNGAVPHHWAGDRIIQHGDVVVLDYGCLYRNYPSDITRTVVVGEPSDKVRRVYEVVKRAQADAVAFARPSVPPEEVDRVARGHIADAGYGPEFLHRTGHGIGLDVHEDPFIVEGNREPLEAGATFSVEPGIYLSGEFGVRIEDIVLLTPSGAEPLTRCTRELTSVR